MLFCGLQKLAMVDYPGKLAATVFTGGCNLRCPFCHNALLVTRLDESPRLEEADILAFLSTRTKLLDGVVLSGGEPLMHPDAADFLRKVRELGFSIKLDTNGFFQSVLQSCWKRTFWTMWPWTSKAAWTATRPPAVFQNWTLPQ